MYAHVTLCGRLAADPIVRETRAGTKVVSATVVTSRRVKRGEEWLEEPSYTDCTLWGKRGETFARFHKKGSPCLIFGNLAQERWEDKDGGKRSKHVVADADFVFLPGKGGGEDAPRPEPQDFGEAPF